MKSTHWHFKFIVFLLFLNIIPFATAFAQFAPNQVSGLKLWLKADSGVIWDANGVSQWSDCSGNNYHAIQNTSSYKPTVETNSLNGKPSIHFDGYDDYLLSIPSISNDKLSVFIVCKILSTGSNIGAFSLYNSATPHDWSSANSIIVLSIQGGTLSAYRNSQSIAYANSLYSAYAMYDILGDGSTLKTYFNTSFSNQISSAGNYGVDKGVIGCRYSSNAFNYFMQMNVSEIIIYNSALNTTDRKFVENYLNNKYAPPVNLGPDIVIPYGFCETTLDAGNRFKHYLWSTGDTTQSIQVSDNGSYSVTATNIFNVISSDTINVNYPQIALADTFYCIGNSLQLSSGLFGNYSYSWSNLETTPFISVTTPGVYAVTITDTNSCVAISNSITVYEDDFPATAGLGPDTINVCSGNAIGLVSPLPLPGNLVYNWSTLENTPQIEIINSGTYSVTVTDSIGCVARDTILVNITGIVPAANFTYNVGCSGTISTFTNASLPIGNSWFWNFGDGHTDIVQNPSHIFTNKGHYTVSLTVSDGLCSKTISKTIYIKGSPTASFFADTACINHTLNFLDQSSSSDGTIVSWDWDFGDSTPHDLSQNPSHQYSIGGIYSVNLTVTTDSSCTSTILHPLVVVSSASPPGNFSLIQPIDNYIASSPLIEFTWNSSLGAASYILMYSTDSLFISNVNSIPDILSTSYQLSFPSTQTYYWRIVGVNICGSQTFSGTRKINFFSLSFISGIQLWLKADSGVDINGNNVSKWSDCSFNNFNAIQNNGSNQPEYIPNSLNGHPSIRFDGSNDYLLSNISLATTDMSVFIICNNLSNINNAGALSLFPASSTNDYDNNNSLMALVNISGSTSAYRNWNETQYTSSLHKSFAIYNLIANGASINNYFNTVFSAQTVTNGSFNFDNGLIGARWVSSIPCFFMNAEIAEIIIFNTALSIPDRKKVENYLQFKYAPPVNLGPDIHISYGLCDTTLDAGSRFIHYLWSTGDTTQTVSIMNSGAYSVTATNIFGQLSTDTVLVSVPDIPVGDTLLCLGDTISYNVNMGTGYTYQWNPNLVTSGYLDISTPGNYSLTVYDSIGCLRTKPFIVVADSFIVQATLGPDKKICKGDYIGLMNGAQQAVNYLWSNGTGNSLLIINDVIGSQPEYSVTVTNYNNCVAKDTIQLIVNGIKPVAAFSSDSVCFGNITQFTDLSSVAPPFHIVDYYWDFSDGLNATVANPLHLFSEDGYYPVLLTVKTDSGCVNSVVDTAKVFSKPAVNFLPYQGCSGVPISFWDKTQCQIGDVNQWFWDFNDPNNQGFDTSTLQNPQYVFDSNGIYTIKVIAISEAGCMDSTTKTVKINKSPALDFSITKACAEQTVYFHDIVDLEPWETIISYNWEFGDGGGSGIANPTHVFDTADIYSTSFTIKTSTGCEVTVVKPIDVGGMPQVDFLYGNNCIQNLTQFNDNSILTNGNIISWHWNFDGLGTSDIVNPGFIFPDTIVYDVSLSVMTDHNCQDSAKHPVKIVAAPFAQFSFSPEYGVPPLEVSFENSSLGANNYLWSFGDNESSTLTNPTHTFQDLGIFKIMLSAYNAIGCLDTVSAKVYVLPTTVDIAILNAAVNEDNGRLYATADLLNQGTRKIEHIDMAIDFGNGYLLHEQWVGNLYEGESIHYEFAVSSQIPKDGNVNFVCIRALLPDLTDDKPENNTSCIAMKDDFLIITPYPNPVMDLINFVYILPFTEQVTIDIADGMGRMVKVIYNGEAMEGYNSVQTDLSELHSGVYTVRIAFRDKVLRQKFVKM